jgi:hypothetical protein
MAFPIIIVPFMKVDGMAIYPFILIRKSADKKDVTLIRHETIHLKQQQEMLILPFYIAYLINYLYNFAKYKNHDDAYRNIIFEREAYKWEKDQEYLRSRQSWACWR